MLNSPTTPVRRFRLAALIWLGSMLGAVAVTVTILPQLGAQVALPGPLWLIAIAGVLQNGLLLGLAAWAGVALSPAVGFRAPMFEAAAEGSLTR